MHAIEVQISDHQDLLEIPEDFIRSAVLRTLQSEGVTQAEVSVAILDDAQIRSINRKFLDHDCATDSISFRLDDNSAKFAPQIDEAAPAHQRKDRPMLLGEVLVSAETAVQAARSANWPAIHELALYLIHGTLHLTGHDDCRAEPRQLMREREREVLRSLGIEMPKEAIVDAVPGRGASERSAAS